MGTSTVYYTRGFELISRREGSIASYYLYDGGLSVRTLTNEAGIVTDTLVFDAFGNETTKTGSSDNPYGFQGEEQDETGLYYLRARYMDPSTGTFTTMDTYGGSLTDPMSLHKYLFANSNPVMYCDPSGHSSLSLEGFALAMGMGAILGAAFSALDYTICALVTDPGMENHDLAGLAESIIWGWAIGALAGIGFFLLGLIPGLSLLFWAVVGFALGVTSGLYRIACGLIDNRYGNSKYGTYEIVMGVIILVISAVSFGTSLRAISKSSSANSCNQTINNKFPGEPQEGIEYNYTSEGGRIHTENGIQDVDFIVDSDGNLHIGKGHSYMSGGNDVRAAGNMRINSQGYIRYINNNSGHYQPTVSEAMRFPQILNECGYKTDNAWIMISGFKVDNYNYVISSETVIVYNGPIKYMPSI